MKIFFLLYFAVLIWSAINPKDYFTWFLEVIPAIIALIVLALTYRKFKLTTLIYSLILIHCIILMIGGHYTYAQVPLFDFIKEVFNQDRNNYDKVIKNVTSSLEKHGMTALGENGNITLDKVSQILEMSMK